MSNLAPYSPQFRVRTDAWGKDETKPATPVVARQPVIDWIRANAPDLRLGKLASCEHWNETEKRSERFEHRRCIAAFTFDGERFNLVSCAGVAEDPDDHVIRLCEDALRKAMKIEAAQGRPREPGLEQQVIEAELQGDASEVARLTQLLIGGQPRDPDRFRPIPIRQRQV